MKRIEPGMLCLVVSGHNAGRECTTVRRVIDGQRIPELGASVRAQAGYIVRTGVPAWLIHGPSIEAKIDNLGIYYINGFGVAREDQLMPISGGDKLEELETEKDLGVTA